MIEAKSNIEFFIDRKGERHNSSLITNASIRTPFLGHDKKYQESKMEKEANTQ